LRFILRFFKVRKVRIITEGFATPCQFYEIGELFYTLPSKSDFLRVYQA
jgi:hypothetical protein